MGSKNNMQRFQLNIPCQSCRHDLHESCEKLQKQGFVTIKCSCTCYRKNNAADGFRAPDSAASNQSHLEVTEEIDS